MKTKTPWHSTWTSLPLLMLACSGQAVDVGSNQGGDSGAGGASGATPGSGANPGTGAVAATGAGASAATGTGASAATGTGASAATGTGASAAMGTGASAAMGAGASAGTGSNPDPLGVGANGNAPPEPNCDSSTYTPGAAPNPWPNPATCQPGASSMQGTWAGYVQGLDAGSYPNEGNFRLSVEGDDAALCGSIIFGEPVELPPVTDPEQAYLVTGGMYIGPQVLQGFAYTLLDIEVSGKRVTFGISLAEPYGAWCAQQTPYYDVFGEGAWKCTPNLGSTYQGNDRCVLQDVCSSAQYEVSCAHHEMCNDLSTNNACTCNAEGCAANIEHQGPRFDLRFEANEAEGELNRSLIFLDRE